MAPQPAPVTISDAVHRAVRVLDPTGNDQNLGELLERFEDDDQPVGVAHEAGQRIAEGVGALDPQAEDAAIQLAGAVATYLCYRRDELSEDGNALIRLAVRAEYDGHPPEPMKGWLAAAGVEV